MKTREWMGTGAKEEISVKDREVGTILQGGVTHLRSSVILFIKD